MAVESGITKVIARIRRLPDAVADKTVEVMRQKINENSKNPTGALANSVRKEKYADGSYHVGTHKYTKGPYAIREVGAIITKGRKALEPRPDHHFKYLRWEGPDGVHFAKKVGPADEPNPFLKETAEEIRPEVQSIWDHL